MSEERLKELKDVHKLRYRYQEDYLYFQKTGLVTLTHKLGELLNILSEYGSAFSNFPDNHKSSQEKTE